MKSTKSSIVIALLLVGLAFPAHAQLGNIVNKAKDAAKKEASKKKETSEQSDNTPAESQPGNTEVPKKSSIAEKLSNSPIDADPYLRVSLSKLKASYETIDHNVYLNRDTDSPELFYNGVYASYKYLSVTRIMNARMMAAGPESLPCVLKYEEARMYVLPSENAINMCFAAYRAFPADLYSMLLEGRTVLKAMAGGTLNIDYKQVNTIMVQVIEENGVPKLGFGMDKQKKNVSLGYGYHDAYLERGAAVFTQEERVNSWKEEEARLLKLYRENIKFDAVKNSLVNLMAMAADEYKYEETLWLPITHT